MALWSPKRKWSDVSTDATLSPPLAQLLTCEYFSLSFQEIAISCNSSLFRRRNRHDCCVYVKQREILIIFDARFESFSNNCKRKIEKLTFGDCLGQWLWYGHLVIPVVNERCLKGLSQLYCYDLRFDYCPFVWIFALCRELAAKFPSRWIVWLDLSLPTFEPFLFWTHIAMR